MSRMGYQVPLRGTSRILPDEGPGSLDPPFRAVMEMDGETEVIVNPGLYRLVASYSAQPPGFGSASPEMYCDTDKPDQPLCLNEWVVSVGERVFLGVDPTVLGNLGQNLEAVTPTGGTAELGSAFLSRVASEVTGRYQAASANVVAMAGSSLPDGHPRPFASDTPYPRPFLAHELRDQLPPSGGGNPVPNYGCTNPAGRFPLRNPNLNLAPTTDYGISRELLLSAPSWGPSGEWEDHPAKKTDRNDQFCALPGNPCPADILFNRYVAVMAHETAHGFGVLTPKPYLTHGTPPVPATMQAVTNGFNQTSGEYEEYSASEEADSDQFHEPILQSAGFGKWSPQANGWLMTWAANRWNSTEPRERRAYDLNPPPSNPAWQPSLWLVFDRPLRFSLTEDYLQDYPPRTDQSIQRYFRERLPLCLLGRRDCR